MKKPPDPHHRRRFPADLASYAVWLYHVFSLSFRDVELLLAERGVIVSYEMGWTAPRRQCAKLRVRKTYRKGAARDEHQHDRPG
jgi:transposase-like protein